MPNRWTKKIVPAAALAMLGSGGLIAAGARPAIGQINPGRELEARLKRAQAGETIILRSAEYGAVTFPRRHYSPAIRIIAGKARFTGLVLTGVSGVAFIGGTVTGDGGRSYGIRITAASHLSFDRLSITGAHRGIVVSDSSDLSFSAIRMTGLVSDGIDIATSRRITVRDSSCSDFRPVKAVFDAAGTMLRDGDHPDCIQAWSRPTAPPVADLIIENNTADGAMQGVFLGNHVRAGVDDGGFDRITVRNNWVRVSTYNGIALGTARDSVVTGNRVETLPGGVNPRRPGSTIRASLRVTGDRNLVCGNVVIGFPNHPSSVPCSPR